MIIYLIGQPCSGKTTLAYELKAKFNKMFPTRPVVILDGDALRAARSNTDYGETGRKNNIMYAQNVAEGLMLSAKLNEDFQPIVILSLVSPYRSVREVLKSRQAVAEVYLHSDRDERIQYHVADYERPLQDFLSVDTDKPLQDCVHHIFDYTLLKFRSHAASIHPVQHEGNL